MPAQATCLTAPWTTTTGDLRAYVRRARTAGIDKTVVLALFNTDYAEANAQVAKVVAQRPGRLIGFSFMHVARDAGRIVEMVYTAVTRWRFRGIKIHGHEALPTREVCETARSRFDYILRAIRKAGPHKLV